MAAAPQSSVNQKLVASEAGVSQSTVSLVLSGRGIIAEKTRRRVLDVADRLNYRPNLLVHGIQTGKTRTVGVMAPPFDSYWSQILYGIHDVLSEADYVPIMLWAPHDTRRRYSRKRFEANELDQIHRLIDRRVDGVILWPAFATVYAEHVDVFRSRDLPVVTIDHEMDARFGAAYVGSDEADGGRLIARHLHQLGHRRVGHLAGPTGETWSLQRRTGFESAWAALPGTSCVTLDAPRGLPSGAIDQARALVARVPELTAIVACTDLHAKVVYEAAAERTLRVPQDMSVVGFSDDDFAASMLPPLTTVAQPAYDIGATAARVLLRLADRDAPGESVREQLPVLLKVRASTAPPYGNASSSDSSSASSTVPPP